MRKGGESETFKMFSAPFTAIISGLAFSYSFTSTHASRPQSKCHCIARTGRLFSSVLSVEQVVRSHLTRKSILEECKVHCKPPYILHTIIRVIAPLICLQIPGGHGACGHGAAEGRRMGIGRAGHGGEPREICEEGVRTNAR
jgi:hypothetical protein